ncbi:hypothetical protein TWF718_011397 [Orbilia javanica]|uniref:Ribosomal RNA-processing protein 43 n=1 Tax=Orbilia javanica TaxID=47235 RepID=A0AAN8MQ04_9PEZI
MVSSSRIQCKGAADALGYCHPVRRWWVGDDDDDDDDDGDGDGDGDDEGKEGVAVNASGVDKSHACELVAISPYPTAEATWPSSAFLLGSDLKLKPKSKPDVEPCKQTTHFQMLHFEGSLDWVFLPVLSTSASLVSTKPLFSPMSSLTPQVDSGESLPPPPPPLTFSTSLFRQISPALYLQRHLLHSPPTRPNGRSPSQCRDFTLTTNSLSHAHGSAVVRAGDTAVVCGIRGEVLTIAPGDDPSRFESYHSSPTSATHACGSRGAGGASWGGLIVTNVELSTGCSKKYPLGPPGGLAQTLSDQLHELVNVTKLVSLDSLRIYDREDYSDVTPNAKIKGYWSLYIDVLCISLDGNILDAAWYAIVAALKSSRLPLASWNQTEERVFCDSSLYHPLSLRRSLPFTTTFALISLPHSDDNGGGTTVLLNDPDSYEEDEACEFLTILSTTDFEIVEGELSRSPLAGLRTRVEKIEKRGGCKIGLRQIESCTHQATSKAARYIQSLMKEQLTPI